MSIIFPKDVLKIIASKVLKDTQTEIDELRMMINSGCSLEVCEYPGCKKIFYHNFNCDDHHAEFLFQSCKSKIKLMTVDYVNECSAGHHVCEQHGDSQYNDIGQYIGVLCQLCALEGGIKN